MGGIGSALTGSGAGLVGGIMGAIPKPFGTLEPSSTEPVAAQFPATAHTGTGAAPGPAAPPAIGAGAGIDNRIMIGQVNDPVSKIVTAGQRQQRSVEIGAMGTRRWL